MHSSVIARLSKYVPRRARKVACGEETVRMATARRMRGTQLHPFTSFRDARECDHEFSHAKCGQGRGEGRHHHRGVAGPGRLWRRRWLRWRYSPATATSAAQRIRDECAGLRWRGGRGVHGYAFEEPVGTI